jgi:hypothetical protein
MSSPSSGSKNKSSKNPTWSSNSCLWTEYTALCRRREKFQIDHCWADPSTGRISATYQPAHAAICGSRCLVTVLLSIFTIALHRDIRFAKPLCKFQRSSAYWYVEKFDSIILVIDWSYVWNVRFIFTFRILVRETIRSLSPLPTYS